MQVSSPLLNITLSHSAPQGATPWAIAGCDVECLEQILPQITNLSTIFTKEILNHDSKYVFAHNGITEKIMETSELEKS